MLSLLGNEIDHDIATISMYHMKNPNTIKMEFFLLKWVFNFIYSEKKTEWKDLFW